MVYLYGKKVAEEILSDVKNRIALSGKTPGLAAILVGDDAPSHLYVNLKEKAAHDAGIYFEKILFSAETTLEEIVGRIDELNHRSDIHGIIVQLPLPKELPTDEIISHIDPEKDTDGFHQKTLDRFLSGEDAMCPVFPRAIVELLRATGQILNGERGLILANSVLMGKVMSQALTFEGLRAEYILSSEGREKIISKSKDARVIVTACGIPDFVIGEMLGDKTVVIDGGISTVDEKVVGDVEIESVEKKAAYLSPVPGGVGPVTVATLLARVTDAALRKE